nr:hypothetical protein Iba_chr04dCG14320 [Ipomoea batatas]
MRLIQSKLVDWKLEARSVIDKRKSIKTFLTQIFEVFTLFAGTLLEKQVVVVCSNLGIQAEGCMNTYHQCYTLQAPQLLESSKIQNTTRKRHDPQFSSRVKNDNL